MKSNIKTFLFFCMITCLAALSLNATSTLLFENSDFEKGTLENWTATGDAFKYQPLKGDYLFARTKFVKSTHKGEYWIGTFEKCLDPNKPPSKSVQTDRPTGTLVSIPFEIKEDAIQFLLGGGLFKQEHGIYVALQIGGREVLKTKKGRNNERMIPVCWDVSKFKGKTAQIVIADKYSGAWGHINVDDFRYGKPAPAPAPKKVAAAKPKPKKKAVKAAKNKKKEKQTGASEFILKEADYPKALAAIVKKYPGSRVNSGNQNDNEVVARLFKKDGVAKKVYDYYRKEVTAAGWKIKNESDFAGAKTYEFTKDGREFIVSIRVVNDLTMITLALPLK